MFKIGCWTVSHLHAASLGGHDAPGCVPLMHFHYGPAIVHFHPRALRLHPGFSVPLVHLSTFTPATPAPQVILRKSADNSISLVQVSVPRVQISIPQVQLHPGTSRPPCNAVRKCDTAKRYIFKFLNMLTTLKKNKPHVGISRTLYLSNIQQASPIS
jgi:hypothetical protein